MLIIRQPGSVAKVAKTFGPATVAAFATEEDFLQLKRWNAMLEGGSLNRPSGRRTRPAGAPAGGDGSQWLERLCLLLVLLFVGAVTGNAEEPAEKFLAALIANQDYDVAIEYLEQLQGSSLVAAAFQQKIPLEKANLLRLSMRRTNSPSRREQYLEQAESVLEQFLESNPPAELQSQAERKRAELLFSRAGLLIDQSRRASVTDAEQASLRQQARQYLVEANELYEQNRRRLADQIRVARDASDSASRIRELEDEFAIVRRVAPTIKEKIADTFDEDDPQREQLLTAAAEEFMELYERYAKYKGGLDSALYAARCRAKLNQFDEAASLVVTYIFSQPESPELYELKKMGALVALEAWESMDPVRNNEIVQYLEPILATMRPSDAKRPEWQKLQLGLARAAHQVASTIKQDRPTADERRMMNELFSEAVRLARDIAKTPGPFRENARELLLAWGEKIGEVADEASPPETIGEAKERGQALVVDLDRQAAELEALEQQIAAGVSDPEAAAELARATANLESRTQETLEMLRLALNLADESTPADDISMIRYYQAHCYFRLQQYLETAVIGRFLLDHYPDKTGARQAMLLVCQSYWQLYKSADAGDKEFELQQLKKNGLDLLQQWPDSAEAETAAQMLAVVALQAGDALQAEEYLNRMSGNSPNRRLLLLSVGQSLWQMYLKASKDPESTETGESLNDILDRAAGYLEQGLAALSADSLTTYQARCALSLTELYLERGEIEPAVQQLESASIAPLDLIKQKHPAITDALRKDIYRAAIRAYLGAMKSGENTQTWLEKAQASVDALALEFEGREASQRQLVAIYYRLAQQLQSQFESIQDPAQKKYFGSGLEVFLNGIAQNATSRDVLIWSGATMTDVGDALLQTGARESARDLFRNAISVFNRVREEFGPLDDKIELQLNRRQALAHRGIGEFDKAIGLFETILAQPDQRFIDVQMDAATTYQRWGDVSRDAQHFLKAVMGGGSYTHPETNQTSKLFVGWRAIAAAAQRSRNPSMLAEAVFNLSYCQFEYAKLTGKDNVREAALKQIENYQKANPQSGGPDWAPRFEQLIRDIQAAAG